MEHNVHEAFHELAEQIINLLSIIDTPIGRRKLGINSDGDGEGDQHNTMVVKEAKRTLKELDEKGYIDPSFRHSYKEIYDPI